MSYDIDISNLFLNKYEKREISDFFITFIYGLKQWMDGYKDDLAGKDSFYIMKN